MRMQLMLAGVLWNMNRVAENISAEIWLPEILIYAELKF